jgi:hypothetical protein
MFGDSSGIHRLGLKWHESRRSTKRLATKTNRPDEVTGEHKEARLCRMYSIVSAPSQTPLD